MFHCSVMLWFPLSMLPFALLGYREDNSQIFSLLAIHNTFKSDRVDLSVETHCFVRYGAIKIKVTAAKKSHKC